jgi:hypothetical protein
VFEIDETQIGFVDERGRLQRVVRPLARHLPSRQPLQLRVNDRQELLQRGLIAILPSGEETRDIGLGTSTTGIGLAFVRGHAFYRAGGRDDETRLTS